MAGGSSETRRKNFDAANISIALTGRAAELLENLGIEYREVGDHFQCACPVHQSDNPTSFTLYCEPGTQGSSMCWSRSCQTDYINTTLGLVRAVLSTRERRAVSFGEAVAWAKDFLGGKIPDAAGDCTQKRIDANLSRASAAPKKSDYPSIKDIVGRLEIPSPYFLSRGFSPKILEEFCVGEPKNSVPAYLPLFNRAIVPILDGDGDSVLGYTARARSDEITPKWYHQNVETGQILYGYHQAKESIGQLEEVILVEGPGDLWRMREAGVENVVCMFGISIKDRQQIILEMSGCLNILVGTDNDPAGEKGFESILTKMGHLFNIKRRRPTLHDWGCESLEVIKRTFLR